MNQDVMMVEKRKHISGKTQLVPWKPEWKQQGAQQQREVRAL